MLPSRAVRERGDRRVGSGNMSAHAIEQLGRAASKGVAIVRSSRVVSAMVLRNHEIDDDRLGFIAAAISMHPSRASSCSWR